MLEAQIKKELIEAMKARDELRLNVLRGLKSAFVNEQVAKGQKPDVPIEDEGALAVVKRLVKQRKDSAEQFRAGGRPELAEQEDKERALLEAYLPATLPREEIEKVARVKQQELGATDKSKAGILMGAVMKELKGKADGADVKAVVDALLA